METVGIFDDIEQGADFMAAFADDEDKDKENSQ